MSDRKICPVMSAEPEIKPCPFCGNCSPFTYITVFTAVIECDCGATLRKNSATVLYKLDEVPNELSDHTYDAKLLVMRQHDGTSKEWPDHGYVGVNALAALEYSGALGRWNARNPSGEPFPDPAREGE